MKPSRLAAAALALLACLAVVRGAAGHALEPAYLELRELGDDRGGSFTGRGKKHTVGSLGQVGDTTHAWMPPQLATMRAHPPDGPAESGLRRQSCGGVGVPATDHGDVPRR